MLECHNLSDLVIGGRYIESLRDQDFAGELNQPENHLPTGKYNPDEFEEWEEIEVIIDHETGQVTITGYPDADFESLIE